MKITDEYLYQHAAVARDIWLSTLLPDDEIPEHQFSKRFERKMNLLIKEQKRSPKLNKALRYLKRTVAVAMIALVITFSGFMTVEAYRTKVIEIVVQVFNELTNYRFVSNISEIELPNIVFQYVPDEMENKDTRHSPRHSYFFFEDNAGRFFELSQRVISSDGDSTIIVDTENSASQKLYINGIETVVNTKNSESTLLWSKSNILYQMHGNIELDELIKIAEQIEEVNN